jgi:superfamily II DNA or RNA helicase
MAIILRPYQERAVAEVREAFQTGHNGVVMQIPTGGGKTLTAGHILQSAAARGNDGMFIVNRVELIEQTALAFDRLGMAGSYGIIASGFTGNPRAAVQIASIDTLKSRLRRPELAAKIRLPRLRVYDECRSMGSAGWTSVFDTLRAQGGKDLGLDATPIRLDGKGLDVYFSHLVCGPQYSELMALGALVPFDVYAPSIPDMSGVRMKGSDYDQSAVEAVVDKPQLVGDVVSHYVQHAMGKSCITFAVSRKHSEHLAESYRAAGVAAVHLDGDTDKGERKQMVRAFRRGEIKVLCNVDLFTAGFDVPGVEVITMVRPTQSLSVFLQQAGRGSRPEAEIGKDRCILLDHAGNVFRHGLPDMDREWSLAGRVKGERKKKPGEDGPAVKQCPVCYAAFVPAPKCPNGHVQPIDHRQVAQVEGDLKRIQAADLAHLKAKEKKQLKAAKTIEELEALAKERGYGPSWAKHTLEARKGAKAKRLDAWSAKRMEAQAQAYRR